MFVKELCMGGIWPHVAGEVGSNVKCAYGFRKMNLPDNSVSASESGDRTVADAILKNLGIRSIQSDAADPDIGEVTLLDGSKMQLSQVERLIPCFTPGTAIATPRGGSAVENLKVGDRVITRDNGIQRIEWIGKKRLDHVELKALKGLRPIRISAGALGPNVPDRDMLVSPAHRMLVVSEVAQLHFGQSEVLVAAKDMCDIDGVGIADVAYVTYIHFLCSTHEIVLSDGAWSESFQPGDYSMKGLDDDQREELFALFPALSTKEGVKAYRAARATLQKTEAALIFRK